MKDITIFYKKNFIVNECLNSDILYIFNCPSTFKEIKQTIIIQIKKQDLISLKINIYIEKQIQIEMK